MSKTLFNEQISKSNPKTSPAVLSVEQYSTAAKLEADIKSIVAGKNNSLIVIRGEVKDDTCMPYYPCTLEPLYPYNRIPLYLYTIIPVYPHTFIQLYPYTLIPVYPYTLIPLYPYTLIPLCPYALMPLRDLPVHYLADCMRLVT